MWIDLKLSKSPIFESFSACSILLRYCVGWAEAPHLRELQEVMMCMWLCKTPQQNNL